MIIPDYIERSSRKTLSLSVMKDGAVCVKAPLNMSDTVINNFIEQKQDWLRSKLSFISKTRDKFASVIAGEQFLLYGNAYAIIRSAEKKIRASENFELLVPQKIENDKLSSKIKAWYKKVASQVLTNRIKVISERVGLVPREIKIGDSRGRWGACNSNQTVIINFRVLMLPPAIIDYVLVHELCHLKEMNHSARFWSLVESIMPTFSKPKKAIKEYGFLLNLY